MRIWVGSSSSLRATSLAALLGVLGFQAVFDPDAARCAAGVLELEDALPPFPTAPDIPTLLVTDAPEACVFALIRSGFRGRIGTRDGGSALRSALTAVARGEIWLEPAAHRRFVDHLRTLARPIN